MTIISMGVCTNRRLICYSKEIKDGQPILVSSNSLPVKHLKFEPAGHAFHSTALKLMGCFKEDEPEETSDSGSNNKDRSYAPSESYSCKGKKKDGGKDKEQDHYALLGLAHLRYLASEDQIRKSYREAALRHHPDKQAALLLAEESEAARQTKKDEIESHFKSIQEAYEVLMDPIKRRIYDSTDEFDDDIPTDCAPPDFFKVFGAAFARNGRWSVSHPVPSLGDDATPMEEVDVFYDFWYSFKSWREFPHADEFDLEQAESRDHKRWMERQNAKLSEKARKEEYIRVRTLVDNAYKRDPRVLRMKEEERAKKQRKKEAKILARKLQEEEASRIAEEERRKKEEEDRIAAEAAVRQRKLKEREKQLLRKERGRLRTLSSSNVPGVTSQDVESLCMSLGLVSLRELCDRIEGRDRHEQARLLVDALAHNTGRRDEHKVQQNGRAEVNGFDPFDHERKEKPWGKEEIELVRKGMAKYPKGTSKRWEVISDYIGTGRSVEEILKATKTVLLEKPDASKAFVSFLEKRKAAQPITSPLTTRDQTGVSDECCDDGEVPKCGVNQNDTWSAVQEQALVQALKAFPKDTNQRWERVAAAIPGRSVVECKKKYASMIADFRNKKT